MKTIATFVVVFAFHIQPPASHSISVISGIPGFIAGEDTVYYVAVENMPQPIGGIQAIQQNVLYPEIMRRAGIEGTVYVEAFVDELGNVVRTAIVKGVDPALDRAAGEAVTKTKFHPGQEKGKPVKVRLSIPIRFRLNVKGEAEKHTLYTGNYLFNAGAVVVPEKAQWRALNTKAHPDRVLLVLEDAWGEKDGFWSVMSYLTRSEATKLSEALRKIAETTDGEKDEPTPDPAMKDFVQNPEQLPAPIGGIQAIMQLIVYPESAKKDKVEGTVHVIAYIDEKGNVANTSIAKGIREDLNEAAESAVRRVRFSPGVRKGMPVKARMTIPIRFKLRK